VNLKSWPQALILVASFFILVACASAPGGRSLLDEKLDQPKRESMATQAKRQKLRDALSLDATPEAPGYDGYEQLGNDKFTGTPARANTRSYDQDAEDITLNLVNASVPAAAKSVLGDTLQLAYSVDARVVGSITIETPQPVSETQLLAMFEAALRDAGGGITVQGKNYRIVPLAESMRSASALQTGTPDAALAGNRPTLIPLRYVSAAEIQDILTSMLPPGMILKADTRRNAIIIAGSAQDIRSIKETISVFDVDWMKGMSFALVPVRSSSPAAIVQDLEQVFETRSGVLKGVVKFVPNNRLKSVLVISSRAKYLKEATRWIKKLDVLSESSEEGLHVYHVQNRTAAELAGILTKVLESGGGQQAQGSVAPRYNSAVASDNGSADAQRIAGGPETPAGGLDAVPDNADNQLPDENYVDQAQPTELPKKVRVVADDSNNSLLIFATATEFERIKQVLEEIDSVPNQVLLEAVIAEVTLDDDLKFGVRWFLGDDKNKGTFSDLATGAVASAFPGFSYFLKSNDIGFALNAISSVTDVKVLSSPSLVVLDNKSATLQVGDQVPIVTQSAKGTAAGDAPIVNNVELKDTGVILRVTPRVNDSGLVTLDIEQEVSSVIKTTTSGIDSPTIRQRKLKTSVVVNDSEALALGGLIQERETTGKSKVPVLGDIPIVGTAFRNKSNAVSRTELIIFIRPRVIRDVNEARRVTAEFRKELSVQAPRVRRGEPTPGEELLRIVR
jgi:general secretion pathway protein D